MRHGVSWSLPVFSDVKGKERGEIVEVASICRFCNHNRLMQPTLNASSASYRSFFFFLFDLNYFSFFEKKTITEKDSPYDLVW